MELFAFDDDYVRRLRAGDRETEEHFRSYFTELLRLKLRRTVRPEEIDDYIQEVFLRVLRAIKTRNEPGDGRKLGAYVIAICNNLIAERMRVSGRTDQLDDKVHQPSIPSSAYDAIATQQNAERVRRVLALLPDRDAAILRAVFFDEREKDEICAEFGIDRGYLRVLVHRAIERFRNLLR